VIFLQILGFILGTFIVLLIAFLAGLSITGQDKRAYPALSSSQSVTIGSDSLPVGTLAKIYQPLTKHQSSLSTPPLLWDFYEAIETETILTFIYYHFWQDEIHPNPAIHAFYWLYRAAYYGYPVRDIEYCQVDVNKNNGEVSKIRFETSPGSNFFVTVSHHITVIYSRTSEGIYDADLKELSGEIITHQAVVQVDFVNKRVVTGPATWNHLSKLVPADDPSYDLTFNVDLKYLSDAEYRRHKFSRKSHGDFMTVENTALRNAVTGGLLLVAAAGIIAAFVKIFLS
jgi:hypothetical protein